MLHLWRALCCCCCCCCRQGISALGIIFGSSASLQQGKITEDCSRHHIFAQIVCCLDCFSFIDETQNSAKIWKWFIFIFDGLWINKPKEIFLSRRVLCRLDVVTQHATCKTALPIEVFFLLWFHWCPSIYLSSIGWNFWKMSKAHDTVA